MTNNGCATAPGSGTNPSRCRWSELPRVREQRGADLPTGFVVFPSGGCLVSFPAGILSTAGLMARPRKTASARKNPVGPRPSSYPARREAPQYPGVPQRGRPRCLISPRAAPPKAPLLPWGTMYLTESTLL